MKLNRDENVFSVTEINIHIKNMLENNLPQFFVEGEISNFVRHNSGHIYFSLKDANSTIRCVYFRHYNQYLNFRPKNGDKVICAGKISVYEKGGNYQVNVTRIFQEGKGLLQQKFEELKEKLSAEGLFDSIYKKEIPRFPEKIGIITSETGAAIQDILNVINRRFPVKLVLFPATVQGENAPSELIAGIKYFNENYPVDTIIIGRGGGSQEDLFCFNDENLARAVFASKIPIISAVGHEIDFTICDFVSDLRAPTPSAAAELAVPNKEELLQKVNHLRNKLIDSTVNHLTKKRHYVSELNSDLKDFHPRNVLQSYQQRLDEATIHLQNHLNIISHKKEKLANLSGKLHHLVHTNYLTKKNNISTFLDEKNNQLDRLVKNAISSKQQILYEYKASLKELSPYNALKRGYSIIRAEGKIRKQIKEFSINQQIEVTVSDGVLDCTIKNIEKRNTK